MGMMMSGLNGKKWLTGIKIKCPKCSEELSLCFDLNSIHNSNRYNNNCVCDECDKVIKEI
jgi:hypothetical protein